MTYREKVSIDKSFEENIGKCPSCKGTLIVFPDRKVFEEVTQKFGEVKCKLGCPSCGIYMELKSWDVADNQYHAICKTLKERWNKFLKDVKK